MLFSPLAHYGAVFLALTLVGHTVLENACGGDATGFKQLSLFELVSNRGSKNLPLIASAI